MLQRHQQIPHWIVDQDRAPKKEIAESSMKSNYQLLLAVTCVAFLVGCQGDESRPTLDYAPENVETIRELQGLKMPEVESESSEAADDSEVEEDSEE